MGAKNSNSKTKQATALAKVDAYDGQIVALAGGETAETLDLVFREIVGATPSVFDFPSSSVPTGGQTSWPIPNLEGGEDSVPEIKGVIVSVHTVRSYFAESFDDSGGGPPTCFSPDTIVGVGDPGGDCGRCQFAQWGSATDAKGNAARGQACSIRKHVLLLTTDSLLPTFINLPVTSAKPCQRYQMTLGGKGLLLADVVTAVGLTKDPGPPPYSIATFRVAGALSPELRDAARKYAARIKDVVYPDVEQQAIKDITPKKE